MNYPVSIIIPVYNVEKYIERCAVSLFEQDFEQIEYIFVDDGSPDNSIELLQKVIAKYLQRQPHIKIIHHDENKGLGWARNTGMQYATGEYVIHIDSDDWCELDMITLLYGKAKENNADIVGCDLFASYHDRDILRKQYYSDDRLDNLSKIILAREIFPCVFTKLVKRDLYSKHNIYPPKAISFSEDWWLMIRLFSVAQRFAYVPKAFVHYWRENENSVMNGEKNDKFWQDFRWFCSTTDAFLRQSELLIETQALNDYLLTFKKAVSSSVIRNINMQKDCHKEQLAFVYPDSMSIRYDVAVVTVTKGKASLAHCLNSVIHQSYPVKHYVYIDGEEYEERSVEILSAYPDVEVIVVPEYSLPIYSRTGELGELREDAIYAQACQEIDAKIICFLAEDSYYDYHHVKTIVQAFKEEADANLVYTNRRYVDANRQVICEDNANSLGLCERIAAVELEITFKNHDLVTRLDVDKTQLKFADISCMAVSKSYASQYLERNQPEVNTKKGLTIWQQALRHHANILGVGKCTVNCFFEDNLPTIQDVDEKQRPEFIKAYLLALHDAVPKLLGHRLWQQKIKNW